MSSKADMEHSFNQQSGRIGRSRWVPGLPALHSKIRRGCYFRKCYHTWVGQGLLWFMIRFCTFAHHQMSILHARCGKKKLELYCKELSLFWGPTMCFADFSAWKWTACVSDNIALVEVKNHSRDLCAQSSGFWRLPCPAAPPIVSFSDVSMSKAANRRVCAGLFMLRI